MILAFMQYSETLSVYFDQTILDAAQMQQFARDHIYMIKSLLVK